MKKSIVLATVVAAVLNSGVATAELSANAAIYSNYIWRGVTQTLDQSAGQGGIDWGHDSGVYVGTWVSNVNYGVFDGYEMDVYAGFSGEAGSFGYDLGAITYQYPVTPGSNFSEVYASGSIAGVTAGFAYTVDKASGITSDAGDDDLYVHAGYDFSANNVDYSIYVGDYSFDADSSGDYSHYGASLSKDGFSFAVDKNDIEGGSADNVRFTVGYAID
ncbi:MAG: TorF family putative porin, partial [Gammaproteobacteria bacterium]|nr:TorF family putative porin [Gammaproteobacteria bacterium]